MTKKPKPKLPTFKDWREVIDVHPAADALPTMSPDEIRALADDIAANGLQHPILYIRPDCADGKPIILDGRNRLNALALLGVPLFVLDRPTIRFDWAVRLNRKYFRPYDPPDDDKLYDNCPDDEIPEEVYYPKAIRSLNVVRRHLTTEQKREAVARLLAATPGRSDRQIGKDAGVDHKTVAAARRKLEATGEVPQLTERKGGDGKTRPAARVVKDDEAKATVDAWHKEEKKRKEAKREARLPDQHEAAGQLAVKIKDAAEDGKLGPLFEQAAALATVADDIDNARRDQLQRACRRMAAQWSALADRFGK